MTKYISNLLGEIPDYIVEYIKQNKDKDFVSYFQEMKKYYKYGIARIAISYLDTLFEEPVTLKGYEIQSILIARGLTEEDATAVIKILSSNQRTINRLSEKGLAEQDIIYGLENGYKSRLQLLNIVSITTEKWYAFQQDITIYPLYKIPEYEPEYISIPEIIYRSQGTFTYTKGKKKIELRIWYQSKLQIQEQELIDKWNEANTNATNLPASNMSNLLDSLEADPGFEINHIIQKSEVERELDNWYGLLIFTDNKTGNKYIYEVL